MAFAVVAFTVFAGLQGCSVRPLAGQVAIDEARIAALGLPSSLQQPVLIVVLSPRMPYALREWPRMRDTAQRLGFEVLEFRDPRVGRQEWGDAVLALGHPALASVPAIDAATASQLNLLNHTPAALVADCGQLHRWPVLGVMPDAPWRLALTTRLQSLHQHCRKDFE